jgi:hypothetical protein
MNQEFMTVMELTACHMPEDPVFPAPAEGYVVPFVAFSKQGFDKPSHWFLHLLLQHYSLELHNLNPSGVLHITSFMNLCEAYLWNYFFCARRS